MTVTASSAATPTRTAASTAISVRRVFRARLIPCLLGVDVLHSKKGGGCSAAGVEQGLLGGRGETEVGGGHPGRVDPDGPTAHTGLLVPVPVPVAGQRLERAQSHPA